ncbi:unannotated protein [freshwater metagenome]|uniref:Unannotated protein n=1 Tax=freshwater metagenome TaxID=449393 RepID=A0A6J6EUV9_9ZZZZ
MITTNDIVNVTWPISWVVVPPGMPVYTWVNTRNRATPKTSSGVTIGTIISVLAPVEVRLRQRCSPIAIATPIGVAISMQRPARRSVFHIAVCSVSSCHTDATGSPQYQRNDGDWNADRLRPELSEMRTATSTGSSDHRTYSQVSNASQRARPWRLRNGRGALIARPRAGPASWPAGSTPSARTAAA